jgi:hypothetical protein
LNDGPGVVAPKPRKALDEPPGVFIMLDGSGVDLGGGVEGAACKVRGVRATFGFGTAGEGEAARNMSKSAPESSPF